MTKIKTDATATAALSALGASARAARVPQAGAAIDFPNNDMPCIDNYKASIAHIGDLANRYQGLLATDADTCVAALETLNEADRQIANKISGSAK